MLLVLEILLFFVPKIYIHLVESKELHIHMPVRVGQVRHVFTLVKSRCLQTVRTCSLALEI
jgi:hypothetical protein